MAMKVLLNGIDWRPAEPPVVAAHSDWAIRVDEDVGFDADPESLIWTV
jgi:hypothetical protein